MDRLYQLGYRKFGLFIQYDSYGRSGAEGVRKALAKYNLEIMEETTYQRGVSYKASMQEQVDRIKDRGIEVVISIGAYQECAAFIRDARNSGLNSIIANVSFVGSDQMIEILADEAKKNKVDYSHRLINSQVVPAWSDKKRAIVKEYQRDLAQYDANAKFNFISLEGYISAKAFYEYIKQPNATISRDAFVKAIKNSSPIAIGLDEPLIFKKGSNQATDKVYFTSFEEYQPHEVQDWEKYRK